MSKIIDDAFLYANMQGAEKEMLSDIPQESELSHAFSRRFQRKMKALMKYERRSPAMRVVFRQMKTAAAVFVVVLSLSFGTVMSVEAYRMRFFTFITTAWEELTSIVTGSEQNADHDKLTAIAPTYLPDGYAVSEQKVDRYENTIIYHNESGSEIYYSQDLITQGELIVDTEGVPLDEMMIENQKVLMLQKNGTVQFFWNDTFYAYTLIGKADVSELTKMAESVIKK
ncbi:MAG: DUF4367 domain-containing protein [Oscillospiraceae bacterium]